MRSGDLGLLLSGIDLAHTRRRCWYERAGYPPVIVCAGKHRTRARRKLQVNDQPRALSDAIDDLPTARALIASLQEQLTTSQREIAALRHELDILCQRLFGRKSERVDPRQLKLALEQLANERGPVTEPVEMGSGETPVRGHARRRPTGRRPLPAHLPRRRVEIDVTDAEKQCAC